MKTTALVVFLIFVLYTLGIWALTAYMVVSTHNPLWLLLLFAL